VSVPDSLRFELLGPVKAWRDGSEIGLGSPQQRAVLAVLLLREGRNASQEEIVRAVWTDDPPRSAIGTVRTYVYRLRQVLDGDRAGAPDPVLVSWSGGGYAVAPGAAAVDLDEFRALTTRAAVARRDGDPGGASGLLHAALALWKGDPLGGLPPGEYLDRQRDRLVELRLAALESRLDVDLELGRDADLVVELSALVAEHPLRERFRELLMLALYRAGRQAEALAAYQGGRLVLTEQLGVEPGAGLRTLHERILRADPALLHRSPAAPTPAAPTPAAPTPETPTPETTDTAGEEAADPAPPRVVPAQLPGDVFAFTGRDAELAALDGVAAPAGADARAAGRAGAAIAVLSGAAGAGKTALAVHWGRRVADRFPDGQLYVNLLGYSRERALRTIDALARFLRAVGTPPEQVPEDVEEAAALYRSLLAGRRMLVLLDNVRDADQARALLPGAPGCVVVITSRDMLGGLVASDGARSVPVGPLARADSLRLLAKLLDSAALAGDADADELARLCADLPLALRIVAANALRSPGRSVAAQAARLRTGDRLAELAVDGDDRATVRAAYDLSYAALPAAAARAFRLLGLAPGLDISGAAAAAVLGATGAETRAALRQLTSRHLLVETAPDRYAWHDLLRLYAAQRAATEDPQPDRAAAADRLYRHYLARTTAAARSLYPQTSRLPAPAGEPAPEPFADHGAASAWLEAELANLLTVAAHAAANGPHPASWQLPDALCGYFFMTRDAVSWRSVTQTGLWAAQAAGDVAGEASMRLSFAALAWAQDRYAAAADDAGRAVELARRGRWLTGEAGALGLLGNVQVSLGDLPAAARNLRAALELDLRADNVGAQALRLSTLGVISYMLGRLAEAVDLHRAARTAQARLGTPSGQAMTLANLSVAQLELGDVAAAGESIEEALRLCRSVGHRAGEAQLVACSAQLRSVQGSYGAARELARTAVASARAAGDVQYEVEATVVLAAAERGMADYGGAVRSGERATELARAVGSRYEYLKALVDLGAARAWLGQDRIALAHLEEALAAAREAGYALVEGQALTTLSEAHLIAGRAAAAVEAGELAAAIHRATGERPDAARTDLVLAQAYDRLGQRDGSARHAERAGALYAQMGVPVPAHRYEAVDCGLSDAG
jgi:DNA-binding SARP family transcriptional activator